MRNDEKDHSHRERGTRVLLLLNALLHRQSPGGPANPGFVDSCALPVLEWCTENCGWLPRRQVEREGA